MKSIDMQQSSPLFRRSRRTSALQFSEIMRISEKAQALKEQGRAILSFGTGEPDFPTPEHVIRAANDAAIAGDTSYPPVQGVSRLRAAIAAQAGFQCDPSQVIVSAGSKQVLSDGLLSLIDPGEELILPAPYWTSYVNMADFCEAKAVTVVCRAEDDFLMTPEALDAAITPKTRCLLLNSPSNPSGAMYSPQQLAALADVLRLHPHVWVISDEIYQHITYAPFVGFLEAAPDLAERTLVVNGVSKAHAMTGWRVGWGIGPKALIQTMTAVQGQSTSGACSISQAAAVAALTGPQEHLQERNAAFRDRRDYVVNALNEINGFYCPTPSGAFYVFPSCVDTFGCKSPNGQRIENDTMLCEYILNVQGVALVPGRAFGAPGYFRLSYAYSKASLAQGLERIKKAMGSLV